MDDAAVDLSQRYGERRLDIGLLLGRFRQAMARLATAMQRPGGQPANRRRTSNARTDGDSDEPNIQDAH
jgi:hypothetical protein